MNATIMLPLVPAFIVFIPIGIFLAIVALVFGLRFIIAILSLIIRFWLPLLVISVVIGLVVLVVNVIGAVFGSDQDNPEAAVSPAQDNPVAAARPAEGAMLFEAVAAEDFETWHLEPGWTVAGSMLTNDGRIESDWVYAPNVPVGITDYAVETEVQILGLAGDTSDCSGANGKRIAIGVRADDVGMSGYYGLFVEYFGNCESTAAELWSVIDDRPTKLDARALIPDSEWHTYRIEVSGSKIRVFLDGTLFMEGASFDQLSGGALSLISTQVRVNVRNCKVMSL